MKKFKRSNRRGQGLVEYGLAITLIALVCIGVLTLTGQDVDRTVEKSNVPLAQAATTVGDQSAPANPD